MLKNKRSVYTLLGIFLIFIILFIYFCTSSKNKISTSYKNPVASDFSINPPEGWKQVIDLSSTTSPSNLTIQYLSLGIPAIFSMGTSTPKLFENTDPVIFVTDRKIITNDKYKDPADVVSVKEYAAKVKNNFVPIALEPAENYKLIEDEAVTLNDGTPAYLIGNSFDASAHVSSQSIKTTSSKNIQATSSPVEQSGQVMHFRGLYLIVMKNNRLYVVTATTDQSKWNEYSDSLKKTLLGFQVSKI